MKEYFYQWKSEDGSGQGFIEGSPQEVARTVVDRARDVTDGRITVLLWRPTAAYEVESGSHHLQILPIPKKITE